MSLQQAIVELVRHDPSYTNDRASSVLLPPQRELPELRDKLMQAVTSTNMTNATRILADAFIMYPAIVVCENLLRPILTYTVELRKRDIIPQATETFVSTLHTVTDPPLDRSLLFPRRRIRVSLRRYSYRFPRAMKRSSKKGSPV